MQPAQCNFFFMLLGLALMTTACAGGEGAARGAEAEVTYERVVSLSGAITETLYTLGHGDRVVGVDNTSSYPPETEPLRTLGHVSQLSAEGVLSLRPDLVFAEATDSANTALQQVAQAGVEVVFIDKPESLEAPRRLLAGVAEKLGDPAGRRAGLEREVDADRSRLEAMVQGMTRSPRVLFIYARGRGTMMVAGTGTPAEAMIEAAGGRNAVTDFEDFRALSAEGLIEAQPDVLLLFESGMESLGGTEQLMAVPGVAQTPAGREGRIIIMDGHFLLGFGPRTAQAALELSNKLQPGVAL